MQKKEVNWAKNDLVRAVFVDEVNIRDFQRGHIRHFLPKILISAVRAQFWADLPHFFSAA